MEEIFEKVQNENVVEVQATVGGTVAEPTDIRATVKRQKKVFSKVGLGMFVLVLIISVAQLVAINVIYSLWPDFCVKNYNLVSMLPITIVGLPGFFIMNKLNENAPKIEQKFAFGVKQFIPFIFIAVAAMSVFSFIANLLNVVLSSMVDRQATTAVGELIAESPMWQNILTIAILAPILEELLFRKLIIDKFSRYGEGVAILVSALMFGLYHGNIVQFIYATVLGLVFGYVYAKSRNIIFTIIMHMVVNLFSGVLINWMASATNIMEISAKLTELQLAGDMDGVVEYTMANMSKIALYYAYSGFYGAMVIAGIVLFIVNLVIHIKRKNMFLPGAEKLVEGKKFQTVVLNVGILLFTIFWIGMTVYSFLTSYIL